MQRSLWTLLDVVAILGSAGGAAAALLGIGPLTYALALPMALPVLSILAGISREGLEQQVRLHGEQACWKDTDGHFNTCHLLWCCGHTCHILWS
jgi:hypothetical protein